MKFNSSETDYKEIGQQKMKKNQNRKGKVEE